MEKDLETLSTSELEKLVHKGENLHLPSSQASVAKRILETRRHHELMEAAQTPSKTEAVLDLKDLTIFYSWQSDLPNKTNRTLIEEALESAIKNIGQDDSIEIVPRLDKDTAGVPGSPNIASTILEKIDRAFMVVSDISIIGSLTKNRPSPNPNVLYELGYAVKGKGIGNVIMVQNTAYGDPKQLPFDLQVHRVLTYRCRSSDKPAATGRELAKKFENAIKAVLDSISNLSESKGVESSVESEFYEIISEKKPAIVLESKLKPHINKILGELNASNLYKYSDNNITIGEFSYRKSAVEMVLKDYIPVLINFGKWASKDYLEIIGRQFERILQVPEPESYKEIWENLAHYPSLIFFFGIGMGSVFNNNKDALHVLLNAKLYNRYTGEDDPIIRTVSIFNVFRHYKDLNREDRRYFPQSDELFEFFKPYFEDLSQNKYEDLFDTFEYLVSLYYGRWELQRDKTFWVPTGAYAYRKRRRKIWQVVTADFRKSKTDWIFFDCFDTDLQTLEKVFEDTNRFIENISEHYW